MATPREELLALAKNAAQLPGVYLMKDESEAVLYVGKAKNLKNRVTTYFQGTEHENGRIEMMVRQVHRFDVILTETESEALILECTLIKRYKPKFNVRLKDDKTYPYLKIQTHQDYPRIEWTRRVLRDGAHYFGPFPSSQAARETSELLNETFLLRDCSDNTFRHRSRPCILFQMMKCSGACVQKVSKEDYGASIHEVVQILEGKANTLIDELKMKMETAAEEEKFEVAAKIRDQIHNLDAVTAVQGAIEAGSERDRDVVGFASGAAESHGVIVQIRGGKIISVKHYRLQNTDTAFSEGEILLQFLSQHYGLAKDKKESTLVAPNEILVETKPAESDWFESVFELKVKTPEGSTDEQLLRVAKTNAKNALDQADGKSQGHGMQALEDIFTKLHLVRFPHRIECFDISNTQGEDSVASRVVFVNGAPDKNLYRKYKIKTVVGADDFASMKEVISRRFSNADEAFPDLVVVDGGRGQLAQASAIFEELDIQGVQVVGLAKARTESNFKSKEVKSSMERIFIPNRVNPVALFPHTEAYKLLTHIRDEAHRFAITFHRQLRSKRSLRTGGKSEGK